MEAFKGEAHIITAVVSFFVVLLANFICVAVFLRIGIRRAVHRGAHVVAAEDVVSIVSAVGSVLALALGVQVPEAFSLGSAFTFAAVVSPLIPRAMSVSLAPLLRVGITKPGVDPAVV